MKRLLAISAVLFAFTGIHAWDCGGLWMRDLGSMDNGCVNAIPEIDSIVTAYINKYSIAGASLAVMRGDSLLYAKGYGWADKGSGELMQPYHRMRIASCSKLLTAAGVMKLADERKLTLQDRPFAPDGKLRWIVPWQYDKRIEDITVEQLLRHTSGISCTMSNGDPMFGPGSNDLVGVCRWVLGLPLGQDPGLKAEYSNVGYFLLGRLIESVTGENYSEWMDREIFKPLGCNQFAIGWTYESDRMEHEVHYHMHAEAKPDLDYHGNGVICEACYGSNNIHALESDGGWIGTAPELCRIVAGIDGCGIINDVLSKNAIAVMSLRKDDISMPVGWYNIDEKGVLTRTGSFSGTTAIIRFYPESGECWVLLTNTSTKYGPSISKASSAMIEELRTHAHRLKNVNYFHLD